jgi:hypothetical protein
MLDSVFEYQKERIGDQYQHHLVAPVEQAQYTALKQRSEGDRDDKGRGGHHRLAAPP